MKIRPTRKGARGGPKGAGLVSEKAVIGARQVSGFLPLPRPVRRGNRIRRQKRQVLFEQDLRAVSGEIPDFELPAPRGHQQVSIAVPVRPLELIQRTVSFITRADYLGGAPGSVRWMKRIGRCTPSQLGDRLPSFTYLAWAVGGIPFNCSPIRSASFRSLSAPPIAPASSAARSVWRAVHSGCRVFGRASL